MILIDAVKLKKSLPKYTDYWEAQAWIDEAEEIDAIPVEWIEKWLKAQERITLINPPYYNQVRVPKMLEDWRAEHEVNRR